MQKPWVFITASGPGLYCLSLLTFQSPLSVLPQRRKAYIKVMIVGKNKASNSSESHKDTVSWYVKRKRISDWTPLYVVRLKWKPTLYPTFIFLPWSVWFCTNYSLYIMPTFFCLNFRAGFGVWTNNNHSFVISNSSRQMFLRRRKLLLNGIWYL